MMINNNNNNKTNNRYYRISTKKDLILSKELKNITVGLILGDLYAERKSFRHNTRLILGQSTNNSEYIKHLYELYKEYTKTPPKTYTTKGGLLHIKGLIYSKDKFNTLSLNCFNEFRENFYNKEGVKMIPSILEDNLTLQGVAYWYIDDGYKTGNYYVFCTESFTYIENMRLSFIMKNKFHLNSQVRKYGKSFRLYICTSSRFEFKKIIKPYIIPHFQYKLE